MESLKAENEAITKYQFNKEQIALSLPIFISRSFSLFLLTQRATRMMCHYQATPSFTDRVLDLFWGVDVSDWFMEAFQKSQLVAFFLHFINVTIVQYKQKC